MKLAYLAPLCCALLCYCAADARADDAEPAGGAALSLIPSNAQSGSLNTIYRYRNAQGRIVYTNILDQVPMNQRGGKHAVDLSKVTLNTEIGNELDASMRSQFETLSSSPQCRKAVAQAKQWWQPLWSEYGHLIVLAGLLLGLLVATPYALKHVDMPTWTRTLTKSFALIGFMGLFMHTSMRVSKTYEALRATADPCQQETWDRLATKPDGRGAQVKLLMDLQQMMRQSQGRIDDVQLQQLMQGAK